MGFWLLASTSLAGRLSASITNDEVVMFADTSSRGCAWCVVEGATLTIWHKELADGPDSLWVHEITQPQRCLDDDAWAVARRPWQGSSGNFRRQDVDRLFF
jgi:hypothetical protein